MFIIQVLLALVGALIFTSIFVLITGYGRHADAGPSAGALIMPFVLLFLAVWAGGLWLVPFGPLVAEVAWLPFVLIGGFVMLVLAAAAPPRHLPPSDVLEARRTGEAPVAPALFGLAFWILAVGLGAAVVVAYLR